MTTAAYRGTSISLTVYENVDHYAWNQIFSSAIYIFLLLFVGSIVGAEG